MTTRRIVLGGAGALVIMGAGGALGAAKMLAVSKDKPETKAEAYAALLAAVQQDYINGRVGVHDRWVLSQHEIDRLGKVKPKAS